MSVVFPAVRDFSLCAERWRPICFCFTFLTACYIAIMINSLLAISLHLLALPGLRDQTITLQCGAQVSFVDHSQDPEISWMYYDAQIASAYPNAVLFGHATNRYNCHSFAFYAQQPAYRNYEIYGEEIEDILSAYFTEVSFTDVVPGDRILYYSCPSGTAGGDYLEHSGIVSKKISGSSSYSGNLTGLDKVFVNSKWGKYGLYRHVGNYCTYADQQGSLAIQKIRFFHINYSHTHSYSYSSDSTYHFKQCSCGCFYEEHTFVPYNIPTSNLLSPQYIPGWRCNQCHYVTEVDPFI